MSPTTSQQWTRRIRYSDQHIRVSDTERNSVAELLGQHYADGRLDQAEFDDRVGRAMHAKTRGDLNGLFSDLPDTGAPAVPDQPPRRPGRGHPILLLVLLVIIGSALAHALWWTAGPVIWLAFLVVAVLLLTRTIGRPHAHHGDARHRDEQRPDGYRSGR